MENLTNERPTTHLKNRLLHTFTFIDDVDLSNKDVLNIGCGYGWFELNVIPKNIRSIIGIEISEKDLETAKKYVKHDLVQFRVGSALDTYLNDKQFDTVTAWEVIEHIPKNTEDHMFQEVSRVLKKNGVFYLSTPHSNFLSDILDPAWYFGHRHYKKTTLERIAKKNGFTLGKYAIKGGIWSILSAINMYFSKWVLRRSPLFNTFFENKLEDEYNPEYNGTYNIFLKFIKK